MRATPVRLFKHPLASSLRKREDPLLALSSEELAYMAGLLDGEGCFRIGFVGPAKRHYYPTVQIGMTDYSVIEWVQAKWQSGTIKLNNHTMLNRNPNWKPQFIVRIHGRRAQLLCRLLFPFLKVKRAQAALILRFPYGPGSNGGGKALRPGICKLRNALFASMRQLNKRGPNETNND